MSGSILVSIINIGMRLALRDRSFQVTGTRAVTASPRESNALVFLVAGIHAADKVFGVSASEVATVVIGTTLDSVLCVVSISVGLSIVGSDVSARASFGCRFDRR